MTTTMTETHLTFCRICEALCGLEVEVEDGRIASVSPDSEHVATRGFGCVKGLKQHRLYGSPDRLTQPLARRDGRLVEVSWEEALEGIGRKVRKILGEKHPDAIAMYVGTAAGFGVLHPVFAQGFMTGIGSRSMFSSATQDCANKFAVSTHVYGFPFSLTFPDLERTECLIIVGANPAVSKWSFLQVSNPVERLKALERRGAKLFVVDPRRTETARAAGEHVSIRPDTDVFFYLSFLHEILARDAVNHERVRRFMKGFEALAEVAAPWPPERTAEVTGISAETLRRMVDAYVSADGAALYCSTGVNMGSNGSLAFWIQEVINAITGNLDRRGGTLVGRGVIDFASFGKRFGVLLRKDRSRVGDFASVNDTFPGGILADEIVTPGQRQIRGLFVTGGNPLITMANSGRLREAFRELELLVVTDIFLNETASEAHYVLPATGPFERPDLPFVFPLMLGLQSRPYLQATRPVVAPPGNARDEATLYMDLARACGTPIFGSRVAQKVFEVATALRGLWRRDGRRAMPQELLLSALLRVTRQPSFKKLLEHPHGWMRHPHRAADFLGKRVVTDDGRVHLAPRPLLKQLERLEAGFERELEVREKLKLITKRDITTHNSWTHNLEDFVRGKRSTNYLYMCSQDAARLGLDDGQLVDVSSDVATLRLPLSLLDDLSPGTVALPHGWGHQHAKGLSVASQTTGVNVNLLAADGPDRIERVSGMAQLTGILVDVQPAAGPLVADSWSGTG